MKSTIRDWLSKPIVGSTHAPTTTPASKQSSQPAAIPVGPVSTIQQSVGTRIDPTAIMARDGRTFHTQDLGDYRYATNADDLLLLLSKWDPDVSAGVWNFLRLADSGIKYTAMDTNRKPSAQLQLTVENIIFRMAGMQDFQTWKVYHPVEQVASQIAKYVLIRGGAAAELVLGAGKMAQNIAVIDPITVQFRHTAPGTFMPFQRNQMGTEVPLSIPTFFWNTLDPDADSPYETPPFLPVLQAVLFNISVMQDLEKIVKRTAYPRISIKLLEDTLRKHAPLEIQSDNAKMALWLGAQRDQIGASLKALAPEDAAVFFDSMSIDVLEGRHNPTIDYRPLKEVIDQRIICGLKSLPTILGRQFGSSQTLSGVEALLYAKSVRSIQKVVASILSRTLTLALMLEGYQGYVVVDFKPVNLKPEDDLEAFYNLKQSRVLELLSLGFISDDEAAELLTSSSTLPTTFKPLSGSRFYKKNSNVDAAATAATRNPTASEQAGAGRQRNAG